MMSESVVCNRENLGKRSLNVWICGKQFCKAGQVKQIRQVKAELCRPLLTLD